MNHFLRISVPFFAVLAITLGCQKAVEKPGEKPSETTGEISGGPTGGPMAETESHAHAPGDELVWEEKAKIIDTDFEVWFGHHGSHFHGGDTIEPSVAIMKGGEAFADAKVFNQLADPSDVGTVLTEEVATVYEPASEDEIAHYAQGDLKIPAAATKCLIRFRIELPGMDGFSRDIAVAVGH